MDEEQQEQQQEQQQQIDPVIESEARRTGWQPLEEFKGDPTKWRPADQWVERGREFIPFIKAENESLRSQVNELNSKLTQTNEMVGKMVKIQGKYSEDAYNQQVEDIRQKKRKAAEDQDWDTFTRLDEQQQKMERPEKIDVPEPTKPAVSDGMNKWIGENRAWWGVDKDLTDYAVFLANRMEIEGNPLTKAGSEYELGQEVKRRLMETFPQKFQNPNQQRPDFDAGNIRGTDMKQESQEKTFNDLPDDAKKQCDALIDRLKMQGKTFTREQYVKDYFEEEE